MLYPKINKCSGCVNDYKYKYKILNWWREREEMRREKVRTILEKKNLFET